ncbi:hypothetical protein V6Z11_D05G318100 [Gossypium hirsutum]
MRFCMNKSAIDIQKKSTKSHVLLMATAHILNFHVAFSNVQIHMKHRIMLEVNRQMIVKMNTMSTMNDNQLLKDKIYAGNKKVYQVFLYSKTTASPLQHFSLE